MAPRRTTEEFRRDFDQKALDAQRQAFVSERPATPEEVLEFARGVEADDGVPAGTYYSDDAAASYELDAEIDAVLAGSRPTRFHANAKTARPERRFDTTALHFDTHGTIVSHADYIAHSEKWDYVWRSIRTGDRLLDVGCGTDQMLVRAICQTQAQATKLFYKNGGCYVGVDLNEVKPTNINWAQFIGGLDMTSEAGYETALAAIPGNDDGVAAELGELRGYTLVVALEVIEHMDVPDGKRLLENMRDLLSPDGRIILSTPVYDGKAMARNHKHEYLVWELKELVESVGLTVVKRYGTFTAEPSLKRVLKAERPDLLAIYEEIREFHSSGYASGLFAPMFPDVARNNVWVLVKAEAAADFDPNAEHERLEADGMPL
jgi:2-polyprenyl-3-methyl-5-hydroxy-6-metoxy-1,4-benzoquinol methylase